MKRLPLILAGAWLGGTLIGPAQEPAAKPEAKPETTPPAAPVEPPPPTMVPVDYFSVPDDLEVTVWATSPMIHNPTNMDFDAEGRLYVAEGVDYRGHASRQPEGDRIVVLSDPKGEGHATESHTFVQEKDLVAPLGVAVFGNKVVVSQPPDMLVYTDVDQNGVFDWGGDTREVLLTGFNGRNHDHSLHSVTAGPDGLWYWNQGNTGALFTDKSGKTFRIGSPYVHPAGKAVVDPSTIAGQKSDDGHVWIGGFSARMNPDGSDVTIIGHNYRNSFEQVCNSYGDLYQSDNDDPPACRVTPVLEYGNAGFASRDGQRTWAADKRPGQDVPTAEWRQDDPGTMPAGDVYGGGSPTGMTFYENGALGDKYRGMLLACEAGRNVVFGYYPKPEGAGFKLERFNFLTSNKEGKFAGSDFLGGSNSVSSELKTFFRPSDVTVGPDGALYVADWFDPRVGGHADLDKTTSGTIYRIAPKGFKPHIPKLDLSKTEGQLGALKSPALNVRFTGFVALRAQGEAAVPAVAELLKDPNPYLAARAIWLLAQMGPAGVAKVTPLLGSTDAQVRLVAYRALRRANQDVLALAKRMSTDTSAAVRREVALTMRDYSFEESRDILIEIARHFDGRDRSYLEAFGTGCEGKERAMYQAIVQAAKIPAAEWPEAMSWIAWRLSSPDAVNDFKARALMPQLTLAQRKLMMDGLAFVKSPYAALAMVDLADSPEFPLKDQAVWWLMHLKSALWKNYGLDDALKEKGLYDPENVKLTAVISPEPPPDSGKLQIPEILKLTGDVERGRAAVGVCYTCHKIGSQGVEFAPDLTMFGKTQPREVILNSIINPSAEIAHGYDGTHLVTKDDLVIDGIVMAKGDPVMIKSMGGITQSVPKDRVKSMAPLVRSLMLSAEQLGLTEQTLADIAAYLQSDAIK